MDCLPDSSVHGILQARILEWVAISFIYIYIYMESRKMILMKLFAGQQWIHRHRKQTYEHGGGGEKEGEDGRYG